MTVPLSELVDPEALARLRELAAGADPTEEPVVTVPVLDADLEEIKADPASAIEHKAAGAAQVLEADEETGLVRAIVSVTGVEDKVKDIIEPGAYTETMKKREPIGVWSHDDKTWVARTESAKEYFPGDPFFLGLKTMDGEPWPSAAGAVVVDARFNLETPHGAAAFSDVKFFKGKTGWSIGYRATKAFRNIKTGVRRIKALDWFEYSPVMVGAASQPMTLSVKSLAQPVDADDPTGLAGDELVESLSTEELDRYKTLVESLGLEFKDRVRTPDGARRYGQPIGSVIIPDGLSTNAPLSDKDLDNMVAAARAKGDHTEVRMLEAAREMPPEKRRAALEKGTAGNDRPGLTGRLDKLGGLDGAALHREASNTSSTAVREAARREQQQRAREIARAPQRRVGTQVEAGGKAGRVVGHATTGHVTVRHEDGDIRNYHPELVKDAAAPKPTGPKPSRNSKLADALMDVQDKLEEDKRHDDASEVGQLLNEMVDGQHDDDGGAHIAKVLSAISGDTTASSAIDRALAELKPAGDKPAGDKPARNAEQQAVHDRRVKAVEAEADAVRERMDSGRSSEIQGMSDSELEAERARLQKAGAVTGGSASKADMDVMRDVLREKRARSIEKAGGPTGAHKSPRDYSKSKKERDAAAGAKLSGDLNAAGHGIKPPADNGPKGGGHAVGDKVTWSMSGSRHTGEVTHVRDDGALLIKPDDGGPTAQVPAGSARKVDAPSKAPQTAKEGRDGARAAAAAGGPALPPEGSSPEARSAWISEYQDAARTAARSGSPLPTDPNGSGGSSGPAPERQKALDKVKKRFTGGGYSMPDLDRVKAIQKALDNGDDAKVDKLTDAWQASLTGHNYDLGLQHDLEAIRAKPRKDAGEADRQAAFDRAERARERERGHNAAANARTKEREKLAALNRRRRAQGKNPLLKLPENMKALDLAATSDAELEVKYSEAWAAGDLEVDLEEKRSRASLDTHPNSSNWVEKAGELPPYIREVARAIHEDHGYPLERAIPMAIGRIKRWAAGGGNVSAETRAKAAAAVAEWEALKAKSGKKSDADLLDHIETKALADLEAQPWTGADDVDLEPVLADFDLLETVEGKSAGHAGSDELVDITDLVSAASELKTWDMLDRGRAIAEEARDF